MNEHEKNFLEAAENLAREAVALADGAAGPDDWDAVMDDEPYWNAFMAAYFKLAENRGQA